MTNRMKILVAYDGSECADAVRKQADEAFLKAAKVKDGLRKRITAE